MILDNLNKRLIIYFFYDGEGKVDEYILYMLRELKKNSNEILVVSNGEISKEGKECLADTADNIIERENAGFDCGAYKAALEYYGWEKLSYYDEVVMMNFTIMGPVTSFDEMFKKMNKMDLDFWGITKHYKLDADPFGTCKYGYIPEHIQSHFIAIRKSLLNNKEFRKYWEDMPEIRDYTQAIGYHEAIFTKHFADMGNKWDVYCNTDDIKNMIWFPLMHVPVEMMRDYKCPIIKRRSFFAPYEHSVEEGIGDATRDLYEYIINETDYDINMIWDNILRTCNHLDLVRNMHLDYILSTEYSDEHKCCEILKVKKVALLMHLYFEDLIDKMLEYACNMPEKSDLYITTNDESKKKLIASKAKDRGLKNFEVRVVKNKGRDVTALLIGFRDVIADYDYVCFAHDKKSVQSNPGLTGEGFAKRCYQNVFPTKEFVENVIITFERNPRLGLLVPPFPNHGEYYKLVGSEWSLNYNNTVKLMDDLGVKAPISEDKVPISPYGSVFWFRSKAMKKLFKKEWKYEDFPNEPLPIDGTISHAIERVYPFVAQDGGYYPAIVLSDKFASIEYTTLDFYVREGGRSSEHMKYLEKRSSQANLKYQLKAKILKKIFPFIKV